MMHSGRVTLRAQHYRTGAVEEFVFENDRVISRQRVLDASGAELVFGPGFVDLQCNGYAGIDYNHPDSIPEQIQHSIRAMWRHGCTMVLPTVITAAPERIEHLFRNLVAAMASPEVRRSIPGFHLEGPFISPVDGARGAHPLQHVCPPDTALLTRFQRAAEGLIRLVTLAPEVSGAVPFVSELRKMNILPAIGHTMADAATVRAATEAGALMSTHLGNGCPNTMHRHLNPIFAQLGQPGLAASVIPDGVHLPAEVLTSIARAKGRDLTMIVTDAMAAAGAPPGSYTIGDLTLEVGSDNVVRKPGTPYLAGSALTMNQGVAYFAAATDCRLVDAWDAASKGPIRLLRAAGAVKRADPGTIIAKVGEGEFAVAATLRGTNVLWLDAEARQKK